MKDEQEPTLVHPSSFILHPSSFLGRRTQRMRRFRSGGGWPLAVAVGLLALAAPAARAEDEPEKPKHPDVHPWKIKRWKGDYFYGTNEPPHTFERAGYPNEVSK